MKLGFLLGDATGKGGIEKVVLTLSSALGKSHISDVISLYKGNENITFSNVDSKIVYLSESTETSMYNRSYTALLSYFFDFFYIVKKAISLARLVKRNNFNVLISCDIKMACIIYLVSLFHDCKIVAVEHFEYDVANFILKKIRKYIYRKFDRVITLTCEDEDKYYWLEESKLEVIPNIVKVEHSEVNFDKNNDIIAVGRLTHQKGFDLLIKAWSRIEDSNPDWKLIIYGDGEEKNNLLQLIEDNSLKNVIIKPFTDNIDEVYLKSKLFVLSSRYEGLGMVLIEALAHNLPCVSFDCPAGPKTIIQHDHNGLLVPNGDICSLANTIDLMLNNSELREKYSRNASCSIKIFSEDVVVDKWNKMLSEI
jgi:glycosyltransferase involved in cell wall biosynthesis